MISLTAVDAVLLSMEWAETPDGSVCLQCFGSPPAHKPGCTMDLALGERGLSTQAQRDEARKSIG